MGPCAKQTVTATLVAADGSRFVGTNAVSFPQHSCPRAGLPTGVGYELCADVCGQTAHAEVNALRAAGEAAKGAVLYVEGHFYVCPACTLAAQAAGVFRIELGAPPD